MKDLNRIKVVLAERKRTNKWLAAELDKRSRYHFKMVHQFIPARSCNTEKSGSSFRR